MANRNFPCNKLYQFHIMPILVDCKIAIGASGAVSSVSGPGVAGVTRLSAGVYQIQLQDDYAQLFQMRAQLSSPVSGSAVADGSLVPGTIYQIVSVGTTNWQAAGLQAGITADTGVVFKAANVGGAGSGTAKILDSSGVQSVELLDASASMLVNSSSDPLLGGLVTIKCIGPTSSSVTTPIAVDPAAGSSLNVIMYLSNSSGQ